MTEPSAPFWAQWHTRWSQWSGDRDLDVAIRDAAQADGFARLALTVDHVRLAAVERPGWVQVYDFTICGPLREASEDAAPARRWGVARDDGRRRLVVKLYDNEASRADQFAAWSEGLIVRRRTESTPLRTALLGVFALLVVVALIGAFSGAR